MLKDPEDRYVTTSVKLTSALRIGLSDEHLCRNIDNFRSLHSLADSLGFLLMQENPNLLYLMEKNNQDSHKSALNEFRNKKLVYEFLMEELKKRVRYNSEFLKGLIND